MPSPDEPLKQGSAIALTNVRVFDGDKICGPTRVVIEQGIIGMSDAEVTSELDCENAVLLPGHIDAHVHLYGDHNLIEMARYGVTTALDMATWPIEKLNLLREKSGFTDIRSAGVPATAPGSVHSRIPTLPKEAIVANPIEAAKFVENRVNEGADYIKVIADVPGPSQEILNALVSAAHVIGDNRRKVIAHAVSRKATQMAQQAKVDMITHTPLDEAMSHDEVLQMVQDGCVSIPTLTMMAGVPILAGTDANSAPFVPANVPHGSSLHHELELLVEAGLFNLDALRAATSIPAKHFELGDRGLIEPGRRADLILINGDPLLDIRATTLIQKVWIKGKEISSNAIQDI
ncbi:hypothetical protein H2198_002620 [Neophaeococcomyces mojaviensis]|uniref:Uncharacterized protein n=1 Tax=Neophaeococcomyces mojaviensis TaxID=3383035 RepID=A0ACC3ADV8_9EURO|nr:hypothetical protein H2198_002620 [Knufia sp. JES_112]